MKKAIILNILFLFIWSGIGFTENIKAKIKTLMENTNSLYSISINHAKLINSLKKQIEELKQKQDGNTEKLKKLQAELKAEEQQKQVVDAKLKEMQAKLKELDERAYYKGKKIPVLIPHFNLGVRPEFVTNITDLNSSTDDKQSMVDQRVRVGAEFHPFKQMDAFFTVQDTRRWGDEGTPDGHFNGLDIYNAFIRIHDFGVKGLEFKLGRMQLNLGAGRVIGTDIFALSGRAFDSAIIRYAPSDAVDITAMATILRENGFPTGENRNLYGLYYTGAFLKKRLTADVYGFYLEDGKQIRQLKIGTFGVRMTGEPVKHLHLEGEASIQTGKKMIRNVKHSHLATAYFVSINYQFSGITRPGLGMEFSSASGDANPIDTKDVSYMPLYPSKHRYWGKMDLFTWSGVVDAAFNAHVGYKDKFTAYTSFHAFFLAANGGMVNMAGKDILFPPNKGRTLGYEWDLMLKWQPWRFLRTEITYALFAPAAAAKAAFGNSDLAHCVYAGAFVNF